MDYREIVGAVLGILAEAKVGLLATVDERGAPSMRWMTPAAVDRLPGALYAVTSRAFAKARHLQSESAVSWLFQSRSLDRIGGFAGTATLLDDPGLTAEVLEAIGPNLPIFWRVNRDPKDLVVVETVIASASLFFPLRGERHEAEANHGA